MTEDEFVDEVQSSGVLVYLSATWLRELYQQVLANDLLKDAPISNHPLIHLLSGTAAFQNIMNVVLNTNLLLSRLLKRVQNFCLKLNMQLCY